MRLDCKQLKVGDYCLGTRALAPPTVPAGQQCARAPSPVPPVTASALLPVFPSSFRERQENLSKEEKKRKVQNRLEMNRREHLKLRFEELAIECNLDLKKTTELEVIRSAYAYAMALKRKKRMDKRNIKSLLKQNVALQQRLEELKRECPNFKLESDPE